MPKITDLPTDTAPDSADLVPFVDVTASRTEASTWANVAASTAFSALYAPLATSAPSTALYLPGTSGNTVSTPDVAALDVAGDLDVTAVVKLPRNGVLGIIVSKDESAQRSWNILKDASDLIVFQMYNGTTLSGEAKTSAAVPDNQWVTIRVVKASGSAGAVIYFDGVAQAEAGDTVPSGALTATTAALTIGANFATSNPLTGAVQRVTVKDGSTIVADFRADAPMGTRYSDSTGKVWTINGSAWSWVVE